MWVVTPKQDVRSETRILALEFPTNLILKVGNMKFSKADSLHFKVYQDKCSVSFDRLENKDIKVNSEYQIPKNSITFGWTETKQVEVSVPFCTNEFEIHSLNIEFQR